MTDAAKKIKADYYANYRKANREKINAYQREWRSNNPEKVAAIQERYWEKKIQAKA